MTDSWGHTGPINTALSAHWLTLARHTAEYIALSAGAVVAFRQIMAVLSDVTVVVSIGTLILLWAVQEGPATVPLWAQSLTYTIQSSLKTLSCPVSNTDSTPATLGPGNALGALSELETLGRAGIFIRKQTATLTRLTSQWNKGGAHTLLQCHAPYTALPTSIRATGA